MMLILPNFIDSKLVCDNNSYNIIFIIRFHKLYNTYIKNWCLILIIYNILDKNSLLKCQI